MTERWPACGDQKERRYRLRRSGHDTSLCVCVCARVCVCVCVCACVCVSGGGWDTRRFAEVAAKQEVSSSYPFLYTHTHTHTNTHTHRERQRKKANTATAALGWVDNPIKETCMYRGGCSGCTQRPQVREGPWL